MTPGFHSHRVRDRGYQVYVPPLPSVGPLPTILFLHGMGESGDDNVAQINQGLGKALVAHPERWPFLAIFPQKLDPIVLWDGYVRMLDEILAEVEANYPVDFRRLYLTGLSQGGNGTLILARRLRWQFAAAVPICGWCDPRQATVELGATPTWLFHGDKDQAVPVSAALVLQDYFKGDPAEHRTTIYEGVDHNSWDPAYAEPELPEWLLSHRRP